MEASIRQRITPIDSIRLDGVEVYGSVYVFSCSSAIDLCEKDVQVYGAYRRHRNVAVLSALNV